MDGSIGGGSDNRLAALQAEVDALRGEIKNLAAALSAANGRERSWRELAARLPGAAYRLDSSGLVTFLSGSGVVLGGDFPFRTALTVDEWIARIVPDDRPAYSAFCLSSPVETRALEYRLQSGTGTAWVMDVRSYFPEGGEDGSVACGLVFDISSLKNAGRASSLPAVSGILGSSSALTGMVIHDLKNPLTLISLAAESFTSGSFGKLSDSQLRYAQLVRVSASRQQMILSNLLEIARLEEGSHTVSLGEMEISEIMPELGWVVDYARLEGKRLSIDFPAGTRMCADRALLARVLSNLIVNGLKRTPSGGTVSVRAETGENAVMLTVSDQGEDLDERHAEDIFKPAFLTEAGARMASGLNTGLGLTFCKLAIAALGGGISAGNGEGGVVFRISIKRACPA